MRELDLLEARSVVISSNIPLRQDGEMYADYARRRRDDPGVAVYFQLRGKPMVMARDAYDNVTHNLRSLGLAVEHLRGLERHGGSSMMERAFAGFTALPPPTGVRDTITVDWREELHMGGFDEMDKVDQLAVAEARYRTRAKAAHPDNGGTADAMIRLNMAIGQARQELQS